MNDVNKLEMEFLASIVSVITIKHSVVNKELHIFIVRTCTTVKPLVATTSP